MSAYAERAALDHSRAMQKALADRTMWTWLFHGDALKRYFLLTEEERVRVVSAALRMRVALNGATIVYIEEIYPSTAFGGYRGGFGPISNKMEHRKAMWRAHFVMELTPEFKVTKSREAEYLA